MIDFDDTQTEVVTIELRYAPAFGLWDEAGRIWTRRDHKPLAEALGHEVAEYSLDP